jgi:hypothetical protein
MLTTGSEALRTLAGLDGGPYGILSLYVTVDSAGPGADPAPWQLTLQHRLNALMPLCFVKLFVEPGSG